MNRRHRLTSPTDFKRVRRTGKSYAHPLAVLIVTPNEASVTRLGVTTVQGLGSAVSRNRAKRRLRSAAREYLPSLSPGWDLILIARKGLLDAEWQDVRGAVAELLRRSSTLQEGA